MIDKVKQAVKNLLSGVGFDHGFEHVMRVYDNAMKICDKEDADREIVGLAALLHDVDDYKVFGKEHEEKLINAGKIMSDIEVDAGKQILIFDIIKNMGYSKVLKGIRPSTAEGKVVSDADMLDSCGVIATVRTIAFTSTLGSKRIFDSKVFPVKNLSHDVYQNVKRDDDSAINHHFDKLLRLNELMFTKSGRIEADLRREEMVAFLRAFFRETGATEWQDYLDEFLAGECSDFVL